MTEYRDGKEERELPRPVDTTAALLEALRYLKAVSGERALIGGLALHFYGIERATKDVDLAVTEPQTAQAIQLFADRQVSHLRIGGISIPTASGVRVDLIDRRHQYRALFEEAIRAANQAGARARVGELTVPVVTRPYLIALKLAAARPQDEADIDRLLHQAGLDYPATRAIVEMHLGPFAAKYLDRMARAAGRLDAPREYEDEYSDPAG